MNFSIPLHYIETSLKEENNLLFYKSLDYLIIPAHLTVLTHTVYYTNICEFGLGAHVSEEKSKEKGTNIC